MLDLFGYLHINIKENIYIVLANMKIDLLFVWYLLHLVTQTRCKYPMCIVFMKENNELLQYSMITISNTTESTNMTGVKRTWSNFQTLSSIISYSIANCSIYSHTKATPTLSMVNKMFASPTVKINSEDLTIRKTCEDSSTNILVESLTSLLHRLSIHHIVLLYEDRKMSRNVAFGVKANLINPIQHMFHVKMFEIDNNAVDNILEVLMVDTVLKQKQLVLMILSDIGVSSSIMARAKDYGISTFDVTWVTANGAFPPNVVPPLLLSYQVLGYNSMSAHGREEDLSSCRMTEVLMTNNGDDDEFRLKPTPSIYHTKAQNILNQRKEIRIVSIAEGPFLFERQDLYDNEGFCPDMTMLCLKPVGSGKEVIWQQSCCFGYSVDMILGISKLLGFATELYLVGDGKYGGYDSKTKTYNGMVGDVHSGKADVAVAGLTINNERAKYIDFTTPFMRTEIGIVTLRNIKEDENYFNMDFIANLADETKYAIILLYVLALITLCGLDNCAIYFENQCDRKHRNREHKLYPIEECFSYISGLSFQRDLGGTNPRSYGGRAAAIFFAFGMMAVSTVYTASLTASKVSSNQNGDFKGLKDPRFLNPTTAFKFGTNRDTSIEQFFNNSPIHEYNQMYFFMRKYNVDNVKSGITNILSGELDAYLNEHPFLNHVIPKLGQCKVVIHGNTVGESGYGLAVEKGSPLKDVLSQAILLLSEKGDLKKFNKKWLSDVCKTFESDVSTEKFSLTFFASPFLFICIVSVLCGFGVIIETYAYNYLQQRKKANTNPEDTTAIPSQNVWSFDDVREGYTR